MTDDLGLAVVERTFREMAIDEEWSIREERGFTWWGAWVRERVWAGEAVRSDGETLWHVRARTPAFRNQPDDASTYALLADLNSICAMSAYVFDPDDGTISARCGAFTYDVIAPWLDRFFMTATALQASIAWLQAPELSAGRPLDDEPHASSGIRRDPDDMLNLAGAMPRPPSPLTVRAMRRIARALGSGPVPVSFDKGGSGLTAFPPMGADARALWIVTSEEHPVLGPGVLAGLYVQSQGGPRGLRWVANQLNLAELSDWVGDLRPHAFGAWQTGERGLVHLAFFPSAMLGEPNAEGLQVAIQNFLAWAVVRAQFAADRLLWLEAAARSRYPDDEPAEPDPDAAAGADGASAAEPGPEMNHTADAADDGDPDESVPIRERSFGPASRVPRPPTTMASAHTARELVVDPTEPAAFQELDDAMAEAEDGDRIIVRPGTYRKPVVVDRAVRIEGAGDVATILLEPAGAEALGILASGATVVGLTIRTAMVGNDGSIWSAVAVHDAAVTIEGCRLSTRHGATVWVGGPASRAVLIDCTISDGSQNAVWVAEEGRVELVRCRVTGNRWPLTSSGEHAFLSIKESEILDNLGPGAATMNGGQLVIERTTIARNAGHGVLFAQAAPGSRIEDSVIEENSFVGVLVGESRGVRVIRNRFLRNGTSVGVIAGAAPTILDNEIVGGNLGIGVSGEGCAPLVTGNTITGGTGPGIVVDEGAAGHYESNTISGALGPGIWIDDPGTWPSFTGNHVSSGAAAGVLVSDKAGGDFQSNDLRGNAQGSWSIDEPGDLRRTANLDDGGPSRERADRSSASGYVN